LPENTGYQEQNQVAEDSQWASDLAESPSVKTVKEMPAGEDLSLMMHMQATVSLGNCSSPKLVL